jgi:curved DNA-binding protein
MKIVDYYKLLGISRTASALDIKKAYYRLARKYHPDLTDDSKANINKFILIKQAYRVLGDLENRLKYKIELEQNELMLKREKLEKSSK